MGMKSRGNWNINGCLKSCSNKGLECDSCIRFSKFIEKEAIDDNRRIEAKEIKS